MNNTKQILLYPPTEPGECFDRYAILESKWKSKQSKFGDPQDQDYKNFSNYFDFLYESIDPELLGAILGSEEYKNLFEANKEIFEAIDRGEAGDDNGFKAANLANRKRFEAKRAIQRKYFNTYLSETKTYLIENDKL